MPSMVKDIEKAERALKNAFPKLNLKYFKVTSECDKDYNCIAWAMGLSDRWVDNSGEGSSWWPLPFSDGSSTKEGLVKAFESVGFTRCDNNDKEQGYDKVALYGDPNEDEWLHAARVINELEYHSKRGEDWDFHHDSARDALLNKYYALNSYGIVYQYMKRPKYQRIRNIYYWLLLMFDKMKNEIRNW